MTPPKSSPEGRTVDTLNIFVNPHSLHLGEGRGGVKKQRLPKKPLPKTNNYEIKQNFARQVWEVPDEEFFSQILLTKVPRLSDLNC